MHQFFFYFLNSSKRKAKRSTFFNVPIHQIPNLSPLIDYGRLVSHCFLLPPSVAHRPSQISAEASLRLSQTPEKALRLILSQLGIFSVSTFFN